MRRMPRWLPSAANVMQLDMRTGGILDCRTMSVKESCTGTSRARASWPTKCSTGHPSPAADGDPLSRGRPPRIRRISRPLHRNRLVCPRSKSWTARTRYSPACSWIWRARRYLTTKPVQLPPSHLPVASKRLIPDSKASCYPVCSLSSFRLALLPLPFRPRCRRRDTLRCSR